MSLPSKDMFSERLVLDSLESQRKSLVCVGRNKSDVPVSHQEADLVTTHELGHNFGAEHDPDNIAFCAPRDDQGGKFVMYPIAVSGDHVNNKVNESITVHEV